MSSRDRSAQLHDLRTKGLTADARERTLPLSSAFATLLPTVQRGSVVACEGPAAGSRALAVAAAGYDVVLIETVGADRCLFGAECPGVGSSVNPDTGRTFDDIKPIIESFGWLTAEQKKMIFEGNARKLFKL